jgi:hypothetical protein
VSGFTSGTTSPIGIRCTASVLGRMREVPMRDERLEVSVTFDQRRGGYVGTAPELKASVIALSLGGLRRRVEALMLPDDLRVVLQLDRAARLERDRRRRSRAARPARIRPI